MTDPTDNSIPAAEPVQEPAGGQEPPAPATEPEGTGQAAGTPEDGGDAGLGDAGQRALQQERERRKEAEREARETRDRLAELEAAERRRSVAADKGLSAEQAEMLSGETAEEMAAHADRLLAAFRSEDAGGLRRTPVERLRPGGVPSATGEDYGDVADSVMRGW